MTREIERLRELLGADHIKAEDGEVVAYGKMPNTTQDGWYFVCWDNEIQRYLDAMVIEK